MHLSPDEETTPKQYKLALSDFSTFLSFYFEKFQIKESNKIIK